MSKDTTYEPWNFLFVDVKNTGAELIELVGIGTGHEYVERRIPEYVIDDMEKALNKAALAIKSYRAAVAQKTERLNRADFEALAR